MTFNPVRFASAYHTLQLCTTGQSSELPFQLQVFDQVASTNQTTWEQLASPVTEPLVTIAQSQTAGRGQWGRTWVSSQGGLYLSVGLGLDWPIQQAAQLTLATAWGIATALRTLPGQLSGVQQQLPVQIKWLNDLVLQGRKLGGILTETRVHNSRIEQAVVGVGINWTNPVPPPGITLRSYLAEQATPLIESLELLAALTVYGLLKGYERCQHAGIEAILPDYEALLLHRDRTIAINDQIGTVVGVDASGALRVRLLPTAEADTPGAVPLEVLCQPGSIQLGYDA